MKSINVFKTKYESPFIKSIHKTSSGTNNYLQSILNKREKNNKYININKHNKESIKDNKNFSDKSKKLTMKSFNKENALNEFNQEIKSKKTVSIRIKKNFLNNLENKENQIKKNKNRNDYVNVKSCDVKLPKKYINKLSHRYGNKINNISINDYSTSGKKNNQLFLNLFNNFELIKKEKAQNQYFKTLENENKNILTQNNNNYINNIINININFNKKSKYKNLLNLNLKETLNYVTHNSMNNINNNKKNKKLNLFFKNKNTINYPSFDSKILNTNENEYNHTIANEMISNKPRNKKVFLRILTGNKIRDKNNEKKISFLKLIKPDNKENNISKEKKIKISKDNIFFKLKNKINNHNILLLNNINPNIKNEQNLKKTKKKKNFFIQKNRAYEINIINNHYNLLANKNNFANSPRDNIIKLFLRDKTTIKNKVLENNYNDKPELVKEYNPEILINLLIDEYIFDKNKKDSKIMNITSLNPVIRSCLIDSLIGLQETFKFHDKTLFITVQLFDNFISSTLNTQSSNIKINENNLDIIFTTCFLIASKYEETFIYHLKDYLSIVSDKYTLNDLMNMEYTIMKFFNFDSFPPNILDFFEFFSVFYNFDESLIKKGTIILYVVLCNLNLSKLKSSFIAFSLICLLSKKRQIFNYNDIFAILDSLCENKYKNKIYNKFQALISPLKNINKIKNAEKTILNLMKNIKKEELINLTKILEENNIIF
jgi:hypothetical protein